MKSGKERLADLRARRRAAGFQPKEIWVHPLDWLRVQKYLARVNKRRESAVNQTTEPRK